MGAYIQGTQGQLYDPTTGELVGFVDKNGREQLGLTAAQAAAVAATFAAGGIVAPYLGQVLTACGRLTTVSTTNKQALSRTRHFFGADVSYIRARWPNFLCGQNNGGLETGSGGDITLSIGFAYNGQIYPVTFSGASTVTITDSTLSPWCDPIPVPAVKGGVGWFTHFITSANGIPYDQGVGGAEARDNTNGEDFRWAASGMTDQSQTLPTTALTGGATTTSRFGPIQVVGMHSAPSVIMVGTSILRGEQSSAYGTPAAPAAAGQHGDKGILARVLGPALIPYTNLSQGGSQVAQFLVPANRALRMQLLIGPTGGPVYSHMTTDHSVNDITGANHSETQIAADLTALAALFPGLISFCCTCLPRTTGAWTLADGSDQTVYSVNAFNTRQPALNVLIRAGIAGYTGYFNTVGAVCLAANEAKWYADGATAGLMSGDGTHPTTFAEQRIASFGYVEPSRIRRGVLPV